MIPLTQLQNKLNTQAKIFALLLDLPDLLAEDLFIKGVYDCANLSEAHVRLAYAYSDYDLQYVIKHDSFKYLLINEYDDDELIAELHKDIESIAARIERLTVVNISTLELISNIYKVFGLTDDSRFIVNTGADFRLNWRPYFDALEDPLLVQYSDLKLHDKYYRLVATKFPFEKLSINNIRHYMHIINFQKENDYEGCISEGNTLGKHLDWLLMSLEFLNEGCLADERLSQKTFKIEGGRYLVLGFPIAASLAFDWLKPKLNLRVKQLDGDQKFIIRIDQQALVFYAYRLKANDNYLADVYGSVLSHFDIDDELLKLNSDKFITCFRPYGLEEMKGMRL